MSMAVVQSRAFTNLCTSSRQPGLSCCPQARKQKIQIHASSLQIKSTYSEARKRTKCIPSYFKRLEIVWTYMLRNAAIWRSTMVTVVTAWEPILYELLNLPSRVGGRRVEPEGGLEEDFVYRACGVKDRSTQQACFPGATSDGRTAPTSTSYGEAWRLLRELPVTSPLGAPLDEDIR
jgi:hypothetical protein